MAQKTRYQLIKEGFDIVAAGGRKARMYWDNDNARLSWFIGTTEIARMDATSGFVNLGAGAASFTGSITAFAGGGQASATALTTAMNDVTTVASNFDSVKLPTPIAGQVVRVRNSGAAILSVFPVTGGTINGMAANLSIDVPVGGLVELIAISATAWKLMTTLDLVAPSTQKGNLVIKAADNAGNTQTIITNASQAAARTYTIPDAGASAASFVMTEGAQTLNGVMTFSVGGLFKMRRNAPVAGAGTIRTDAAALLEGFTVITGANGTVGWALPAAPVAGTIVIIKGTTSGVAKIWPNGAGEQINAVGAGNAFSLASGVIPAIFIADSTTQWYSIPLVPS